MRRAFLFLAALALPLATLAADVVAFVADRQGPATIEGQGDVAFLAELSAGARLLVGSNGTVVVTYAASGAEFTARGPGEFVVERTALRAERGAEPAKRSVAAIDAGTVTSVAKIATASVRMRSLRASEPESFLVYPVQTRVATLRPAFRWQQADTAATQELQVRDANGQVVFRQQARPGTFPMALRLAAGRGYRWSINAPGRTSEASFETLPADVMARVHASEAAATTFSARVAHAMLLHELGATQESRDLLVRLGVERPDLAELAALQP